MDTFLHDEEATYYRIELLFEKTINDCFNRKYSGLIQPVQKLLETLDEYSGDHRIANVFSFVHQLLIPLGLDPKSHHYGWSSEPKKDDLIETLLRAAENWRSFLDEEFKEVQDIVEKAKPAHAWDIAVASQPQCEDSVLKTIYRIMPKDVWYNCFTYLSGKDASNAALGNARALIWGSKRVLKVKTLERRQTIFLSYYSPNLKKFEAIASVSDDGLHPISKLRLQHLKIWCSNVSEHGFSHLPGLSVTLETLELTGCWKLSDTAMANIGELKKVSGLEVLTNHGLQALTKLQKLKYLALWKGVNLTDSCLSTITKIPNLKALVIKDCKIHNFPGTPPKDLSFSFVPNGKSNNSKDFFTQLGLL